MATDSKPNAPASAPAASTATTAPAQNPAATTSSATTTNSTSTTDSSKAASPTPPVELVSAERTFIFPKEQTKALIQAVCFVAPPGITDYWSPTNKDLDGVETGLEKFIESKGHAHLNNWAAYYRQVGGVLEGQNEFLLLSYFTLDYSPDGNKTAAKDTPAQVEHWKKEPFWMNDGGDTYFRVLYDVQKKEFVWYERNGNA